MGFNSGFKGLTKLSEECALCSYFVLLLFWVGQNIIFSTLLYSNCQSLPFLLKRDQYRATGAIEFLGPFAKLEKGTINPLNAKLNPICHFLALLGAHPVLHVSRIRVKLHHLCPSVHPCVWNQSALAGRIFVKFEIFMSSENLSRKIQLSLKCDRSNVCFTWRRVHIEDISLNFSLNEKCFGQICRENQNTHFTRIFNNFSPKIMPFMR